LRAESAAAALSVHNPTAYTAHGRVLRSQHSFSAAIRVNPRHPRKKH
jgi:hypothetical protein